MFEIISNPFENVGESLSGLAIEKAIEVVTPSTSKGFSWRRFLFFILILVFGACLYIIFYYLPRKRHEENAMMIEEEGVNYRIEK